MLAPSPDPKSNVVDNNYTNRPASCASHACCLFASGVRNGKAANDHSGVTPSLCLHHADNVLSIVIRVPPPVYLILEQRK